MTSWAHCILVVVFKLPEVWTMAAKEACEGANNSNNTKPFRTILTEDNVPGASLKGRKTEQFKKDELKRWLTQRGEYIWNSYATTSKVTFKCVQFFSIPASLSLNFLFIFYFRVKDYISSGLHNKVIDPDGGIHSNKKQFEKTWLPVFKVMMTLQYPIPHRVTPMTSI